MKHIEADFDMNILNVLYLLSKDLENGEKCSEFKDNSTEYPIKKLLEKRFIKVKEIDIEEPSHYCLTYMGIKYLNKIMNFAKNEYKK